LQKKYGFFFPVQKLVLNKSDRIRIKIRKAGSDNSMVSFPGVYDLLKNASLSLVAFPDYADRLALKVGKCGRAGLEGQLTFSRRETWIFCQKGRCVLDEHECVLNEMYLKIYVRIYRCIQYLQF
jgi:hypothetical protein